MLVKCTSCGASQELATDQKCNYCGSSIEQEKAQENYKSSTTGEIGNLMMMAETAIEATNWDEALQFFNQVLIKDITNSDAWLGKGIAIVYTSKIGDIKTTEAIAYWKNAVKHAINSEPMKLRVAKEINSVVKLFFPNLLNHYLEFSNLDDSYVNLANRFLILEKAMDYAIQICPNEAEFFKTGFDLCETVIKAPGASATSDQFAAAGATIFNALSGNKYAAKNNEDEWRNANERKKQIQIFGHNIKIVENKYREGLINLGVKTESERVVLTNLETSKNDIDLMSEIKKKYVIGIVVFIILFFFPLIFKIPELLIFTVIGIAYFLYNIYSLNKQCKELFGLTLKEVNKIDLDKLRKS